MATNRNTPRRVQKTDRRADRAGLNELGARVDRTQREACKMVSGKPGEPIPEPVRGRPAWIESCGHASGSGSTGTGGGGYGIVKFATGRMDNLVAGDETAKCWISTWFVHHTFVLVAPVETAPGEIEWMAVAHIQGPDFVADPADDGSILATPQDTPAVKHTCTDDVTAP